MSPPVIRTRSTVWKALSHGEGGSCPSGADVTLSPVSYTHLGEELADARFLTSAPSFFQVNTAQAEKLAAEVVEGLGGRMGEEGPEGLDGLLVADLYAGGGTFSVPLARAGADVIAIEAAGSSVRDLRRNAEMNGVDIEVVGGDAARELPELGGLDALVVDPPRAGLADGVAESIAEGRPTSGIWTDR